MPNQRKKGKKMAGGYVDGEVLDEARQILKKNGLDMPKFIQDKLIELIKAEKEKLTKKDNK